MTVNFCQNRPGPGFLLYFGKNSMKTTEAAISEDACDWRASHQCCYTARVHCIEVLAATGESTVASRTTADVGQIDQIELCEP